MTPRLTPERFLKFTRRTGVFRASLLVFAFLLALFGCTGVAGTGATGAKPQWVDAWGTSYLSTTVNNTVPNTAQSFANQTYRMNLFAKLAGNQVRVKFTNKFGVEPLQIGAAHIALRDKGPAIVPATDRALTFGGVPTLTLAPGAETWSDAVELPLAQSGDVTVSVYVPQTIKPTNFHPTGLKTMYFSGPGDFTSATTINRPARNPATATAYYFVSDLQVMASPRTKVIVGFGDSITDGAQSSLDTNTSWPDQLAKRLQGTADGAQYSVINMGIGSNRLVSADAAGPSGVHRFDDDVIARANVTHVIVLEGINDISYEHATAAQLIAGDRQLIAKAHAKGIKIFGATILPILHSTKWSDENEATRAAVNQWIRTSGEFDGVVEFEKAVQDPAEPLSIRANLTSDHVHPNSAGYKLMAEAIDLNLFK